MATPSSIEAISLGSLGWLDITWLLVYLVALSAVTAYANLHVGSANTEQYFLGGRHTHWWAIGFSLFASNLGTDHLVGLAGSGAAGGLAVGNYEFSAIPCLLLLGWCFVPHYLAYDIFTVPEFLEKRFGSDLRTFFTWLTIATTIYTKISVTIFAGAVVLEEVLGWNMWMSSIVLLSLTAVYTAIGGLAAVIYTEVLQSIFLIVGSLALLYFGLNEVGGWTGLTEKLPESHFRLLKPLEHDDFPWLGVLFGMPINSIWYWCTDQVMVQRVLATDQPGQAQAGCVLAGWLKLLPMYIMVLPGLVAAALFPKQIEEDSNRAYALLVTKLLPPGWVGIMIAVMLSSFMAALASCFNSVSTLFTMDVYAKHYPEADEHHLVNVGRGFTLLVAVLSIAWLPVIEGTSDQLFLYIQSLQVIWCAPVALVFLGARFLPTMTSRTAWHVLIFGGAIGVIFWILQNAVPATHVANYGLTEVLTFNILHYSMLSFAICSVVLYASHHFERGADLEEKARLLGPSFEAQLAKQEFSGRTTQGFAVGVMVVVVALTVLHSVWP
jgi:SSS family solute:Na+ symporter